jgi:hypothetical protein
MQKIIKRLKNEIYFSLIINKKTFKRNSSTINFIFIVVILWDVIVDLNIYFK